MFMVRQTLRVMGIGFWSLLSVDILVGLFDYWTRWDFLSSFFTSHPHVAEFTRRPFVYLALLVLGFVFLQAEKRLRLPLIRARYTNVKTSPNLAKITMRSVFDSEMKKPGWDTEELDWFCFVELQLANETATPVTLDEVESKAWAEPQNWKEKVFKFKRKKLTMVPVADFKGYEIDRNGGYGHREAIPNLLKQLEKTPLTQGAGHRGWLCFAVKACQRDLKKPTIDVWLIDALRGKHRVVYEKDEHKWDKLEIHRGIED